SSPRSTHVLGASQRSCVSGSHVGGGGGGGGGTLPRHTPKTKLGSGMKQSSPARHACVASQYGMHWPATPAASALQMRPGARGYEESVHGPPRPRRGEGSPPWQKPAVSPAAGG